MKYYNIPIFVPHLGCPFDCVFCNQRRITGAENRVDEEKVKNIIEEHLKLLPKENCQIEIAFFGGSFTGIEEELQERLLSSASEYVGKSNICGIRVSTRPDYISHAALKRLLKYGGTSIELGVQSMNEEVLLASARGHSGRDVEKAVALIREYPFKLGLQMMTGLPEDTRERSLETADKIIALKPDFVRIYPTLVIKNTGLFDMYNEGTYKPQELSEAVSLCAELLEKFQKENIRVIRVGLQNTDEISPNRSVAAGPYHSAFGELVRSEVYYNKIKSLASGEDMTLLVNPKEVSKATGQKRANIKRAEKELGIKIKIEPCADVRAGEVKGR